MSNIYTLTNISDGEIYTFPFDPLYISPFPESNSQPLVFESGISFDDSFNYIPSETSVANPGAVEKGMKVTISGDGMIESDTKTLYDRWRLAEQQAFYAERYSKTYNYNFQWAEEPKFVPMNCFDTEAGEEVYQYSLTFYII